MGEIRGSLESMGPIVEVKVMATPEHLTLLRAAGRPLPTPITIRVLLDTGATLSVIDGLVLRGLARPASGSTSVHTATTGTRYVDVDLFDVNLSLKDSRGKARNFRINVIGTELANEGFFGLIGWDVLTGCVFTCDGPRETFKLTF